MGLHDLNGFTTGMQRGAPSHSIAAACPSRGPPLTRRRVSSWRRATQLAPRPWKQGCSRSRSDIAYSEGVRCVGPLLGDELLVDEGLVTSSHGRGTWCVRQTPHQSVRRSTRSGSMSEVAATNISLQARS